MQASPVKPALPARKIALALLLLAWFVYFSRDAWRVHFAPDDMMNIDSFYWSPGPWRLFYAQFLVWRGYYRPMGGLFYLPILSIWGLDPAPYHVALSLVLAANVFLFHRLARLLGGGELAAGLAALAACYHAGLGNIYYNTAFVYDALCGFFYLAALTYYIARRATGSLLGTRQKLVFAALFLGALNSKEMALTLPAVLAAYEWIYHPPAFRGGADLPAFRGGAGLPAVPGGADLPAVPGGAGFLGWLRGAGQVAFLAACLAVVDLYGKVFGYDALTGMPGYQPVFSWRRLLDFQKILLHDAAFLQCGWAGILGFWVLVSYLAWRPGARPVLRFCWAFLILTPIPIEFLPGKSQACLYLPMAGLAVFAAVLFTDLARALAGALAGEPLFRRLGRPALTAALIAAGILYWGRENQRRKNVDVKPVMAALGRQTWEVIQQFRALNPHVRPHSQVVFLSDPFREWDMLFIADLWFRDRTVTVHLQRLTPLPPQELARADYLFDYRDGKLLPASR